MKARAPGSSRVSVKASILAVSEDQLEEEEEEVDNEVAVKKRSVLVLGATGTLGRQVVRQFLNSGYDVRCMVRNKADRPFGYLVDWGASVIEGSLNRPETLPSSLVGIHTVIDCASGRGDDNTYDVDWSGKKVFIQCCEKMDIQRYIFLSIKDCDRFPNIPIMSIKSATEKFLAKSGMRYTVLRLSGFMQPLVQQFAVPILENEKVWGDDGTSPGIAYLDSQDCARMVAAAANKERTVGKTLTLTGPKVWGTRELIQLCEKLSGKEADVNVASLPLLQATQAFAGFFDWSAEISERLRFVEVNQMGSYPGSGEVMTEDSYKLLGLDPNTTRKLDTYLGEYYRRVFNKLMKSASSEEKKEGEEAAADDFDKVKQPLVLDSDDVLPPGQAQEKDILLVKQRATARALQAYIQESQLQASEDKTNDWFGWVPLAQLFNGRSAMMGFSLGMFTEWATNVSVVEQINQLIGIFSKEGSQ